jgi:hypothetical protein
VHVESVSGKSRASSGKDIERSLGSRTGGRGSSGLRGGRMG